MLTRLYPCSSLLTLADLAAQTDLAAQRETVGASDEQPQLLTGPRRVPPSAWCESTSTAPTLTIPRRALATFSYSGARFLQCPHLRGSKSKCLQGQKEGASERASEGQGSAGGMERESEGGGDVKSMQRGASEAGQQGDQNRRYNDARRRRGPGNARLCYR